jgi:hypothetical protein
MGTRKGFLKVKTIKSTFVDVIPVESLGEWKTGEGEREAICFSFNSRGNTSGHVSCPLNPKEMRCKNLVCQKKNECHYKDL